MRVLLISANTEKINMHVLPWGLACVATATEQAGHDVLLLDLLREPDARAAIGDAVADLRPDVIGVSVRNIDDQCRARPAFLIEKAREVVRICRDRSDAPIVVGGAGYSIFPESALAYLGADFGIQGEGEVAFPALLDRLERGADLEGVPNLVRPSRPRAPRAFADALDRLPLPAARFLELPAQGEAWMAVQTRRGCGMDCSYCSTAAIEGRAQRRRSPAAVVRWLAQHAGRGCSFYFVDNSFNVPLAYAKELCRQIAAAGLAMSWRCILHPHHVDEELVRLMAAAGCREVSLGFESGCARVLRQMNKKFTVDEVRACARLLGDHGVRRMGFLLLGGPGETRGSVEESLGFAEELALESVRVTAGIRIYPGTALALLAVGEGVIGADDPLLEPRFYLAAGLEPWIDEELSRWRATHPQWVF